ncbi:MAG: hypothetical protein A4E19_08130 [Nitrospira sp. SG-bin1]|nr:MAG: hypothetical protein A4E19_08130 [Nitrospira sp. SG-bin1]
MTRSTWAMLLLGVLFVGGCASGAKPEAMLVRMNVPVHQSQSDVSVSVIGGKETSTMGASQISDQDFAQALQGSIVQSGLFRKATTNSPAAYRLDAFIVQMNQPMFGASMTVSMEVNYSLARTNPKEVVWQKAITSTYTAPFSEALVGVTRLRMANEGAARKNIEQAINEMSQLKLD